MALPICASSEVVGTSPSGAASDVLLDGIVGVLAVLEVFVNVQTVAGSDGRRDILAGFAPVEDLFWSASRTLAPQEAEHSVCARSC
jgi:hypothetical protein